jgi:hypothetical protein
MPSGRREQPHQVVLPQVERELAQIVAIDRQDVEGVKLHSVIVPAGVQAVEVRDAVDAEQDRLAIDDEGPAAVAQRGLYDQRITVGLVVAVAREQPHVVAFALNNQAIAVVLDFVNPVWTAGNLFGCGRKAGLEHSFSHAEKIGEKLRARSHRDGKIWIPVVTVLIGVRPRRVILAATSPVPSDRS